MTGERVAQAGYHPCPHEEKVYRPRAADVRAWRRCHMISGVALGLSLALFLIVLLLAAIR